MKALVVLAAVLLAPPRPPDEPTYELTVELGNVCGKSCIAIIEKGLLAIDGIQSADTIGDKFHFQIVVLEKKSVLPETVVKAMDKIRQESKGEEDFPLVEFALSSLTGTVSGEGEALVFTARGSGQKFLLRPTDDLRKLLASGKARLTLAGTVLEEKEKDGKKPLPILQVTDAKEPPK
jgi:hypothetical protein